jgi:hypothetical protein
MADTKITALAAIATVDPAADVLPIVDISDTSMAASGTTKKVTSNQILQSGGVANLASATITGDLTVDTSTLKVDATNDRVGIGTASPIAGSRLDVRSAIGTGTDIQSLTVIDTSPLAINNGGGLSMGYVFQAPSTVIGRAGYIKTIKENATDNNYASAMVFGVSANGVATAERMRLDSTGNVKIANGNVVMTTSGTGIDFSANNPDPAGKTSELLNDYEEGTFTATLTGGTTNPTIPVTTTARYTKVGRLVTVQIEFIGVTTVGASGTIQITGLPFANGSVASTGIATLYNLATFAGSPVVYLDPSTNTLGFYGLVSNSVYSSVTHNAGVNGYSTTTITYSV